MLGGGRRHDICGPLSCLDFYSSMVHDLIACNCGFIFVFSLAMYLCHLRSYMILVNYTGLYLLFYAVLILVNVFMYVS